MKPVELALDLAIGLVIVGVLWFFGGRLVDYIQAPAKLEAALGDNKALAAGIGAQNTAVEGLKSAAAARKKVSEDAVNKAGGVQFKRSQQILAAPPVGATDYERAVNRIDRELNLQ